MNLTSSIRKKLF